MSTIEEFHCIRSHSFILSSPNPTDTGDRPSVDPEPQDSGYECPSSSALVPRDELSQDDMHDSLLDLADALGGSSDSEEGPEEVVNGASANARVERAKPRPDLVPGGKGLGVVGGA